MKRIFLMLITSIIIVGCSFTKDTEINKPSTNQSIELDEDIKNKANLDGIIRYQEEILAGIDYIKNTNNSDKLKSLIHKIIEDYNVIENLSSKTNFNKDKVYLKTIKTNCLNLKKQINSLMSVLDKYNIDKVDLKNLIIKIDTFYKSIDSINDNDYMYENYNSKETKIHFIQVDNEELEDVLCKSKQSFYLLVVRQNCKPCNDFVEKIISYENEISELYFLDSTNLSENDKTYFKDKYKIDQVPSILCFNKGKCHKAYTGFENFDKFLGEELK